jgi:hypothetical protein
MFCQLKVSKILFFVFMTAPDFFQYTRDLARYFRGRLRSLHSPSVPRPAPPPWLEPDAQASVERVINMLEEAFKSSCMFHF